MFLADKSKIFIAILSTIFLGQFSSVNANPALKADQSTQESLLSSIINFEPPSHKGDPDATASTGSRATPCPNEQSVLTAVVPKTTNKWLTVKEHPKLFVYLPPKSGSVILFQLQDNQQQIVYENLLSIQAEQGKILELKIPENYPPLKINENYQWYVVLVCKYDPELHSDTIESLRKSYPNLANEPFVQVPIKRIESPFSSMIKSEENELISLELAAEYAKNGLWFDTLAILHQLIKEQPENNKFRQAWQELLTSQGIDPEITAAQIEEINYPIQNEEQAETDKQS